MKAHCDPETGICTPSTLQELSTIGTDPEGDKKEIIYVGDPMCSWCWGISPDLTKLRDYYREKKVAFRVLVGGLRPGGGDPWNDQMKDFLRHHWAQVNARSGQPFGYALFDLAEFNYDTEPSCRALVAARPLIKERELEFFEAIQHKFYVESQDPNKPTFYASICDGFDINYGDFLNRFESEPVKQETLNEFNLNRRWGVRGYPTVLLLHNDQLHQIANGYSTFEQMKYYINAVEVQV
ncbi:MAG: DsbA family protein [Bacteroidota bacterium]